MEFTRYDLMAPIEGPTEEDVAVGGHDGVDKWVVGVEHLRAFVGDHSPGADCNFRGCGCLASLLIGLQEGLLLGIFSLLMVRVYFAPGYRSPNGQVRKARIFRVSK